MYYTSNLFYPIIIVYNLIIYDVSPQQMSANIQLKIENLSQFAQEEPNFRRLSDAVYLHGLSWKILAYPREIACPSPAGLKCLSYFLQCNASNEDSAWSCGCSATLKILAQKQGKQNHVRNIKREFSANPSNVLALLKLADRYQCQLLRNRCELHLINCVELPLLELFTCADLYNLNKLKKHLLMNFNETGLSKLYDQSKPYLEMLNLISKMKEEGI